MQLCITEKTDQFGRVGQIIYHHHIGIGERVRDLGKHTALDGAAAGKSDDSDG